MQWIYAEPPDMTADERAALLDELPEPDPDNSCPNCGFVDTLVERHCEIFCRHCRAMVKSCADS